VFVQQGSDGRQLFDGIDDFTTACLFSRHSYKCGTGSKQDRLYVVSRTARQIIKAKLTKTK
jgi:hypothetical protein